MKLIITTMGMQATVDIVDETAKETDIREIFKYFEYINNIFSTYIEGSEISRLNLGLLSTNKTSLEVKEVLRLSSKANRQTNGYFDIHINGKIDPSGIVKGYAIHKAVEKLKKKGYKNFYIGVAGDIEVAGRNEENKLWKIGIENPFNQTLRQSSGQAEIIKVVSLTNSGIATSGNYKQGKHIFNPMTKKIADDIMSITVIAKNVMEADILATAAFAMGEKGVEFLEKIGNVEGYMVRKDKTAVYTTGFNKYVLR